MIYTCQSPAKLNLFLYILKRREDGYHELCSLMTPITLHDNLKLDFTANDLKVFCEHPDVPEDSSNLVIKAANLFFELAEKRNIPVKKKLVIHIDKKIPPGGGLGGGSSNAAQVLKILNQHYNNLFNDQELISLGLKLGADIPFFIKGRPAIATGIGEELEYIENLKSYHLVLCDPGIQASTVEVYKNVDLRLTFAQKDNIRSGLNMPLRGQEFDVGNCLHNDLEKSACNLYPEIEKTKEEMARLLEKPVFMTGSGSSLFALFSRSENARKGYECLQKAWSGSKKRIFLSVFNQANL